MGLSATDEQSKREETAVDVVLMRPPGRLPSKHGTLTINAEIAVLKRFGVDGRPCFSWAFLFYMTSTDQQFYLNLLNQQQPVMLT